MTDICRRYFLAAHSKTSLFSCITLSSTPRNMHCFPSSRLVIVVVSSNIIPESSLTSTPLLTRTTAHLLEFHIFHSLYDHVHGPSRCTQVFFRARTFSAQLVSRTQASPVGGDTSSLMTALSSSSNSAFSFPVPFPSNKLFHTLLASSILLNIFSPYASGWFWWMTEWKSCPIHTIAGMFELTSHTGLITALFVSFDFGCEAGPNCFL